MKRPLLLLAALLLAGSAAAQDWQELLKKAATAAIDKATDGKLTQYAIVGTWGYTGPGVKFESDDWTSEIGGTALEPAIISKLESAYALVGIKPGACSFTFEREGAFTASLGSHNLSGTYEFDASTHVITLHFAKGKYDLGSVPGHAYISGEAFQLVFPVNRLVAMIKTLGNKVSKLAALSNLLEKYDNVYIGFRFDKQTS